MKAKREGEEVKPPAFALWCVPLTVAEREMLARLSLASNKPVQHALLRHSPGQTGVLANVDLTFASLSEDALSALLGVVQLPNLALYE